MKRLFFSIIIIIVFLFLYGRYVEVDNFKVHEITIDNSSVPESFHELKIVHFSDLLYNKDEKKLDKLKNEINSLKPDVIIFTGDLTSKKFKYKNKDYDILKSFLKDLEAYLYKYAIVGDNDKKDLKRYKDLMFESDFKLLDDESELLFYKDERPINIVGINKGKNIDELLTNDIEYDYSIILVHEPDRISSLPGGNLYLSGHSLGGIINIPYYGGLIKKNGAKKYISGNYKVGDKQLYVSNGLGYESFEYRLFNTPSINVYRFN